MRNKPFTLKPVRPSAAATIRYGRELRALVREMNDDILATLRKAYRAEEPEIEDVPVKHEIALDELPSATLKRIMGELARKWRRRFDEAAPLLAAHFAKAASRRSAKALEKMLRDAGFSVQFRMTDAARDAMNASIAEQVGLIKSIPEQYLKGVEGDVMRSVSLGRDLSGLTTDLERNYGVSYRRAAFIARDQNNKATATMTRVRQLELGITKAVWVHSTGGKEPRPTHLAAGRRGQTYDVAKGWWDKDAHGKGKGAYIHPGELINCRCVSKPVVEGFS